MSRKTVSMIGNLTRDMMSDVMETSLKKPIQTGEFRKNPVEPAWRCPAAMASVPGTAMIAAATRSAAYFFFIVLPFPFQLFKPAPFKLFLYKKD